MFHHIEGTVSELMPNLAVIDCGGLGFAVNATMNTVSGLRVGDKARLYVYEAIGESNFDLYGFASKSEKRCFELLLSVSGIGPKAGLSILSCTTPEGLALAIMNNDERALIAAPGVGKRIAQRVILELKDKMSKEMGYGDASSLPAAVSVPGRSGTVNDAVTALGVLGYSSAEIAPVLRKLDTEGMSAEEIIKAVLKQMVK